MSAKSIKPKGPGRNRKGTGSGAGRRNAHGLARKDNHQDITRNNTLTQTLSGFDAARRDRSSLLHEATLAAVTGVRESITALTGRSTILSDTIKEVMDAFRTELANVRHLATEQRLVSSLEMLRGVSDLIEQLMNEILSFNVTEYKAIKELIHAVLASSRHELSQTPPASFESIRFMLEPEYSRNVFSCQSLRTALRSQAVQASTGGEDVNGKDQIG